MSVIVTKTAGATISSERWTNFSYSSLQYLDSSHATCSLGANDSSKWGNGYDFKFSIPLDATVIGVHVAAYWWGSHAGSYINLQIPGLVSAYDEGEVAGGWVSAGLGSGAPTPAQVNDPGYLVTSATVGRTTGAAVDVNIDRIEVSVTYEPYVAPPPPLPPAGAPVVVMTAQPSTTSTTAHLQGEVISDGGSAVVNRGFCLGRVPQGRGIYWGGGTGVGAFDCTAYDLIPGTLYYVCAFAVNAAGCAYSDDANFVTHPQQAGSGGAGLASAISGQLTGYSGGGAGGMLVNRDSGASYSHGGGNGGDQNWNGGAGILNTGGGGGGAGAARAGGAGGKGVVVIRYKTVDAIATSPSLSTSIFRPSLAYREGRLFAPYSAGENAKILTITGNTVASPTIVTTSVAHGIPAATAQVVVIAGSNSTPPIIGSYVATRVSDTTLSIPVNVTTAGTAGKVLYNRSVGWALTSGGYNDVGWLTQSPTTFHTGSMKKDFRYASVSHDVLPDGATVRPMSWLIDGVYGTANGVAYSPQETRYPIDRQGYSIETTLGMTPDYTGSISPVVRGINVIWNFVKNKKHTYSLDCRSGANAGRWGEDPETALQFLFSTANERATFEDKYTGVYRGAIESVEFTPAPISISEGPSGIAKIIVREEQ